MTIMTIVIKENGTDLGPFDVLCGRDKQSYNNVGNRRFRIMINMNLHKYMKCETRTERSNMILGLTYELQEFCGQLRFLKRVKGDNALVQLDYKQSREKIAHALRDAASQHRIMKSKLNSVKNDAKIQSVSCCKMEMRTALNQSRNQRVIFNQLRSSAIIFKDEAAAVDELSHPGFRLSEIFDTAC